MVDNKAPPGWCDNNDIARIAEIAKLVPPNGIIVEVGSLLGQSTYAWSKSCHPSVTIFAIDPWDSNFISDDMMRDFGTLLSKETFRENTRDCANVIPLQGYSPEDINDWNLPIDIYFDDALHHNPPFISNLKFWTPHLKSGGILCGHDYAERFPDIVATVNAFGKTWDQFPQISGFVWSLQKPQSAGLTRFPESTTNQAQIYDVSDNNILGRYLNNIQSRPRVVGVVHDPRNALPNEIQHALDNANCHDFILIPPQILLDDMVGDLYGIKADAASKPYPMSSWFDTILVVEKLSPEMLLGLQNHFWQRLALTHGIIHFHNPTAADLIAHEMACEWIKLEAANLSGAMTFRVERLIPKLVCRVNTATDLPAIQKQMLISRFGSRLPSTTNINVA